MHKYTPLKVGTQVAYIPPHVREECEGNWDCIFLHPETEFGFISSWNKKAVFVRFWDSRLLQTVRTLSCSESCSYEDLELYNSHSIYKVESVIEEYRANPEKYGWYEQNEEKGE